MPEDTIIKFATVVLLILLLSIGMYLIYAVIKKKPLADPEHSDNFIANLPAWPKSVHKELLFIIGVAYSIISLWLLVKYLIRWF